MGMKVAFEIEVQPWLNEDGLNISLYSENGDIETELNFTLEELINKELSCYTIANVLIDSEKADSVLAYLEKVTEYTKKRIKELS
jgi:hypothetical protein